MTREARTTNIASTMTARSVRRALKSASDPGRAITVARFFKTGRGEYGEGDRFIGVTVPSQRAIARRFRDLPLEQVDSLLTSPIHEERSTALLIMVDQFNRAEGPAARRQVFRLYMRCLRYINNWDLVDTSAPTIVGGWIAFQRSRSPRRSSQSTVPGQNNADLLERLARARHLWSRRIAMIATLQFIVRGITATRFASPHSWCMTSMT